VLRNKRKIYPYIFLVLIVISIGALVFLQMRGIKITSPQKEEYYPLVSLSTNIEGSDIAYTYNENLPLNYTFSYLPYQLDIHQAAYSQVGDGVAGKISDSAYLYVGEYDKQQSVGLTKVLDEFPTAIHSSYNRNGSYITPKATNRGYLKEMTVDNTFAVISMATMDSNKVKENYICVLDIQNEEKQRGIIIAGLVDGNSDSAKDYAKSIVESVALTLRENKSFVDKLPEKTTEKEEEKEENPSYENLVVQGVEVDITKPKKEVPTEKPQNTKKEDNKQDNTGKDNRSEGNSQKQENSTPEPTPEPAPQPTPQPTPQPQPAPQPPATDYGDVSVKTFSAPLTDIGMTVVVTTGSYCEATVVTLTLPDGSSMTGNSNGAGTYTFSLTAQEGTYTVTTTNFSAVGTVNIKVHCS